MSATIGFIEHLIDARGPTAIEGHLLKDLDPEDTKEFKEAIKYLLSKSIVVQRGDILYKPKSFKKGVTYEL